MLVRQRDRPRPSAESLLNQAWCQSGLHYFRGGVELAAAIHDAAVLLLDRFQLPAPQRGIMRIKTADLPAFEAAARRVGDTHAIDEVTAAERLGPYFRAGGHYFDVPDGPFPEAELIQLARDDAAGQGVAAIEVDAAVHLESDGHGTVAVIADGTRLEATEIVIVAGCGTPALLEQLDIAHGLEVVRTPLLVVKQDGALRVPLLVDRIAGFAVTQPEPGRLVFGARGELPTSDPTDPAERDATAAERDDLHARFCTASGLALPDVECRAHAGLEIQRKPPIDSEGATLHESSDDRARRKVSRIIGTDPRFSNLRWALPGRATLALSVAHTLASSLELTDRQAAAPVFGSRWRDDIEMFYRASYD
jgi:glycine/D-amino acid oxidase-like deaminating enzyme